MATIPNRSYDLSPSGERKRKQRGTDQVTTGKTGSVTIPEPDESWCKAAQMIWESAEASGVAEFYEQTDWAMLYLACDQITHLYDQGGRRSPEFLRVIVTTLGSLLFTEGDRRRVRIELEKPEESNEVILASVENLFADASS